MSVFFINENMHQIKQKNPRDAEHTQWRLEKQHNIEMMRVINGLKIKKLNIFTCL